MHAKKYLARTNERVMGFFKINTSAFLKKALKGGKSEHKKTSYFTTQFGYL